MSVPDERLRVLVQETGQRSSPLLVRERELYGTTIPSTTWPLSTLLGYEQSTKSLSLNQTDFQVRDLE